VGVERRQDGVRRFAIHTGDYASAGPGIDRGKKGPMYCTGYHPFGARRTPDPGNVEQDEGLVSVRGDQRDQRLALDLAGPGVTEVISISFPDRDWLAWGHFPESRFHGPDLASTRPDTPVVQHRATGWE
jgi:hypothetical protein